MIYGYMTIALLFWSCEKQEPVQVTTAPVINITARSVLTGGEVISDGGYNILARGVCWSTSPEPAITVNAITYDSLGPGSFSSTITGLQKGETYYLRAYALTSEETAYGQEVIFINYNNSYVGTFTDPRDDKEYEWVRNGDQIWMAENLAYLPSVNSVQEAMAGDENDPKYFVYGYDGNSVSEAKATEYYSDYGVLYNWPAAMAACPTGWHLPSFEEWDVLERTVGDECVEDDLGRDYIDAGIRLKSEYGWDNNGHGSDPYGFSALPEGSLNCNNDWNAVCYDDDTVFSFVNEGEFGFWWTSFTRSTYGWWCVDWAAYNRILIYDMNDLLGSCSNKRAGFSVRCIKD